jgi:ATP-binding cassette subfamily B protein
MSSMAGRERPATGRGLASDAEAPSRRPALKPLASLLPFIRPHRGLAAAALVALTVAALATLAVPLAVRRMIDFGFSGQDASLINSYFAVMIAVVAVLAAASAARYYLVTTLGERVVSDLRKAVFAHVVSLSAAFFDTARSGEITSRLTADTTQIKAAIGASVSVALRNLVLFVGAAAMMVVTSGRLSAFVLGVIPVIVLPLVAFGRRVRKRSRAAQDTLAQASAYAAEQIGAIRTLQAFTNEGLATSRFDADVDHAFAAARGATRARAVLTGIGIFLVFASVVVILWVGAQDVLAERMSPGRLGQFVLYAVFAAGALGELSQVWGEISQAAGAAERLFELMAIKPEVVTPERPAALPVPSRGAVAFENLSFAYPSRPDGPVLNNLSLTIAPGQKVAIVGPSGAGKSTLFHLLLRHYDPLAGSISFDGVPLDQVDPRALRQRIALVPQDVTIFAASIRENIRFGRPDASDADVARAAEQALVDEFAAVLPQGLDTPVGERGVTLSGGQRQRVAIARAILRDAPLLLLDEATSALDAASETLVQQALERLMQGRTTIIIAHRLATVLTCDRIVVMDGGRIVEEGRHEDLAAGTGLYARLAKLQFEMA